MSLKYRQAPSSVGVCRPRSSNVSSETTGPIEAKFHLEPLWIGGRKVCSNCPDNMTKMAAMPIYGKNPLKIFFSGTNRARALTQCAELGAQF